MLTYWVFVSKASRQVKIEYVVEQINEQELILKGVVSLDEENLTKLTCGQTISATGKALSLYEGFFDQY
ncbi:hypothetical protein D3C87_1120770 [compost metagenome]